MFREKGREGEREEEKHQCVVASHEPPAGDLAHNPGMCPDWESNQGPLGWQAGTQPTKPHQPGRRRSSSEELTLQTACCPPTTNDVAVVTTAVLMATAKVQKQPECPQGDWSVMHPPSKTRSL